MTKIRVWAIIVLVAGFDSVVGADSWPTWRGPRLDGISTETGWKSNWPEDGPTIAWRKQLGVGYAAIVVHANHVYAMGFEDAPTVEEATEEATEETAATVSKAKHHPGFETVYCFNAEDGKEVWKYRYAAKTNKYLNAGGPAATPTVHENRLYTLSRDGQFHCFNAGGGEIIWKTSIEELTGGGVEGWWTCSSGVIDGRTIVYQHGGAVAIDLRSGKLAWKSQRHPAGYSTPALFQVGSRKRAAIFHAAGLSLVDVDHGVELDNYPWKAAYNIHAATPIVTDRGRKVFASSGYGKGSILFNVSGDKLVPIWGTGDKPNANMRNPMSGCVLYENHLYGFDENHLTCLDIETGEKAWSHRSRKLYKKGALMMADRKLIAITGDGVLAIVAATPSEFRLISSAKVLDRTCWTMPTLADGRIYCRNDVGEMVCVDVREGQ